MSNSVDSLTKATVKRLVVLAERRYGHGWMAEVDRRLGHTRGVLRKSINRETLRLRDFLQVLEVLGISPSEFFSPDSQDEGDLTSDDEVELRLERLAQDTPQPLPIRKLSEFGLPIPTSTEPDLLSRAARAIAKKRRRDPEASLDLATAAAELVVENGLPSKDVFPVLLELSSSYLWSSRVDCATHAFLYVFRFARELEKRTALSEVLFRLPELAVLKTGNYRLALSLSERSFLEFSSQHNAIGQGKAQVLIGRYHFLLEEPARALAALSYAEHLLGANEPEYSFASNLLLARHFKSIDSGIAFSYLEKSKAFVYSQQTDPQILATYSWILGELQIETGLELDGITSLKVAQQLFLDVSPVKAALVTIEIADYFLAAGDVKEATAEAKALAPLLTSLTRYPIAEAAVAELVRIALSGELTSSVLHSMARRIRTGERARQSGASSPPRG